jgi:Reticulon
MTLGVTVAAEVAGKLAFRQGLTSQIRPKKYYVLPRETIDSIIGDVHELINFFVIESQRIVFAENVFASAAVGVFRSLNHAYADFSRFWSWHSFPTT